MKKDKMKLAGLLLAIACLSCGAGGVIAGNTATDNNVVVQAEETGEYTTHQLGTLIPNRNSNGVNASATNTKGLYLSREDGGALPYASWEAKFALESGDGWKKNGETITLGNIVCANEGLYVALSSAGIQAGDVLTVSGTFTYEAEKAKIVITESSFMWTGSVWTKYVAPTTYEIGKIAIDGGSSATAVNLKKASGAAFEATDGTWAEKLYFISGTGVGVTINGTQIKMNDIKIPNNMYVGLGTTAVEGDVLKIGGAFYNANLAVKYVIEESTFIYNGTAWESYVAIEYTTYTVTKIGATGSSTAGELNLYSLGGDELPKAQGDWDNVYAYGTGASVKLNDTEISATIKMPGDLYVPLGTTAAEGDVFTINGTFYNDTKAIKLVFDNCQLQWNGTAWVAVAEEEPEDPTPDNPEVQYTVYELGEMIPHPNSVTNNNPRATQLYMKRADGGSLPYAPSTWDHIFVLESGDGFKKNGESVTVGNLISTNAGLYVDISAANVQVGDVITVSGTFTYEGALAKYVIEESTFTWNGTAWEKYIEYTTHEVGSLRFNSWTAGSNHIYLVRADGKAFPIPDDGNGGWTAVFYPKAGVGVTLNGEPVKAGGMKFPNVLFIEIYTAPAEGDILTIGGTFYNTDLALQYVITETSFKWDGTTWVLQSSEVTPDPDVPEIENVYTVTKVGANSDSSSNTVYLYSLGGDELPKDQGDWTAVYSYAKDASVKLNDTEITAEIKMPGDLYVPLGTNAAAGDILTINGSFYNEDKAVMIVFENCQLQYNEEGKWVAYESDVPSTPTEWSTVDLGNVNVHKHSTSTGTAAKATCLYFKSITVKEYPVNSWQSYFLLESGNGWKLNGNDVTTGNLMSADGHLYVNLENANIQVGDVLSVSGTFACEAEKTKYVIAESKFTWNGTFWEAYVEYTTENLGKVKFAKWTAGNNYIYLVRTDGNGITPPPDGNNGWTETFKWKDGVGVTVNDVTVGTVKFPHEFFIALPMAPKMGDVLRVGGTFYSETYAWAYTVEESAFQWDGSTWVPLMGYTDYEIGALTVSGVQSATDNLDLQKENGGTFEKTGAYTFLGGSGAGLTLNGEAMTNNQIAFIGNTLMITVDPAAQEGDILTIGGTFYNVTAASRFIIEENSFIYENGAWSVYEEDYTMVGLGEVKVLSDASSADMIYLISKDEALELPVNNWDDEFVCGFGLGVTLNDQVVDGVVILSIDNALYLELPEAAQDGDVLKIGGKFVCETQGVLYFVTDSQFTWNVELEAWEGVIKYEVKEVGKLAISGSNTTAGKLNTKATGLSTEVFDLTFESGIGFTVNGESKEATVKNSGGVISFVFDDVQVGDIVKIGGTYYSKTMALKYVIEESTFVWEGEAWSLKYEKVDVGPVVIIAMNSNAQDLYLAPANGQYIIASGWLDPLKCVSGGITVNGVEIDMTNTVKVPDIGTIFARLTDSTDGVANGSIVTVGGVFRCDATAVEYIIEESTFIYQNNAWSNQLDNVKAEKVEALQEYLATFAESDYYETEWSTLQEIVVTAKNMINDSISKITVQELYDKAVAAMDAVATKAEWDADSETMKAAAKAELEGYKNLADYKETEQATITSIIAQAKTDIDACTDWTAFNKVVVDAKAAMDALWTAEKWDASLAVVSAAKAELVSYKLESDYYAAEWSAIQAFIAQANADIDDAIGNEKAIADIVANAKAKMDAVKTAAQVEAEEIVVLAAKTELEGYKTESNYNTAEWNEILSILVEAFEDLDEAIGDDETIAQIVTNAKAAMDKVLTSEEADAKAFEDAKYEAEQAIRAYANAIDYNLYSEEAAGEITEYVEAAMAAIEEATDIDDFATIVAEFEANVASVEKLPSANKPGNNSSKGCGSVVGLTATVTMMAAAATVVLRKKKEDNE